MFIVFNLTTDIMIDGDHHDYARSIGVVTGNVTVRAANYHDTYEVDIGNEITLVVVRKVNPKVGMFMGVHAKRTDTLSTETGGIIGKSKHT